MKNILIFLMLFISVDVMAENKINYKELPDEFYRKHLSDEEYYVCRQEGTEHAFVGEYANHYDDGVYHCKCCGGDFPLFSSDAKYDSGTGWPSFWEAIDENNVELVREKGVAGWLLAKRIEVRCARCGSHLGHVFNDGPSDKTGQRYCMNSVALHFVPAGKKAVNKFTLDGNNLDKDLSNKGKKDNELDDG